MNEEVISEAFAHEGSEANVGNQAQEWVGGKSLFF